ncbi:hypothetical protein C1646_724649 [Rhizophagus diaphanus]|nr:hypothetical protein C1646_724649 [Rhizophagus diaphanus] [Rhizophagus sp. MUCL 43196]
MYNLYRFILFLFIFIYLLTSAAVVTSSRDILDIMLMIGLLNCINTFLYYNY